MAANFAKLQELLRRRRHEFDPTLPGWTPNF
jgi:hypothetical protein